MTTSFLSVRTQFENLGDLLINRELISLLSERGDLVIDASGVPQWFIDALRLPSGAKIVRGRIKFMYSLVGHRLRGRPAFYFFLPGGNFGDYSTLNFLKRTVLLFPWYVLKFLGVKFCQIGTSAERLGPRHTRYLKLRNPLLHAFYVRDIESSSVLSEAGVKHHGLLPDFAFNLFTTESTNNDGSGSVCFSFRTDQHASQLGDCYRIIDRVVSLLPKSTTYWFSVQVERDRKGVEELRELLLKHHKIEAGVFEETRQIARMQEFYRHTESVVSNRLHVLLLAASGGARVVAYADHMNQKITGLFRTIDRVDLLISPQDVGSSKLDKALHAPQINGIEQRQVLVNGIQKIFS